MSTCVHGLETKKRSSAFRGGLRHLVVTLALPEGEVLPEGHRMLENIILNHLFTEDPRSRRYLSNLSGM